MAIAACFFTPTTTSSSANPSVSLPKINPLRPSAILNLNLRLSSSVTSLSHHHKSPFVVLSSTSSSGVDIGGINNNDDDNNRNHGGGGSGGGGNDGNGENDGGDGGNKNMKEALMVLAEAGMDLENMPKDLVAGIEAGKIPGLVVERFLNLQKSSFMRWLMQFGGFKERLLADDLFLAKLIMECGVGIIAKTAAEYDRRRENFFKELEIVFADVVMAIIADFMLVYLPAPTVSLRAPLALNAGGISKFFHGCPDNAFQIALSGNSYTLLQRFGAIARNGAKLFAVGTTSSLVGTAVTNTLINARKAVDKSGEVEVENVPVVATSVAYGVYMAVSSNLRYQLLAGVVEQRILEPMLHQHKLLLSGLCFAVRTGNTYLGSLLWVDYARLVGIQKAHDEKEALA